MATIGGYNVVTNGLVLSLDAANARSYVSGSSTWFDVSGYNYSGSLVNGPGFSSEVGGSIVFDGTNDTVRCVAFSSVSNGISISSFFKVDNLSTSRTIIGKNAHLLAIQSDRIEWWPDVRTGQVTKLIRINTNAWYHIGVTQTGSICNIYLNGQNIYNNSATNQFALDFTQYTSIGAYNSGTERFFSGSIATVSVYHRILSDSEMLQNYNASKGRFGL